MTTAADVFDAADGTWLGALPFTATVQAPDSENSVRYAVDPNGALRAIDLVVY